MQGCAKLPANPPKVEIEASIGSFTTTESHVSCSEFVQVTTAP
jgi:hypothetical protein